MEEFVLRGFFLVEKSWREEGQNFEGVMVKSVGTTGVMEMEDIFERRETWF